MRKIRTNSIADRLVKGIEGGVEKTTSAWAEMLETTPQHISSTLTSLRKRGYHFHPVSNAPGEAGVIKNVIKKERDANKTLQRINKNGSKAHIEAFIFLGNSVVKEYKQLSYEYQLMIEKLLIQILQAKQEGKGLLKEGK